MKIKKLREIINSINNEGLEIFVRNSTNTSGNIEALEQIELSNCITFDKTIPCAILNTNSSKEIETNEKDKCTNIISRHYKNK